MITRKLMVMTLVLGVFASGLMAKETSNYEPAKKPELTLKKSDLALVTKAINKKFKGLTTLERKKIVEFLEDYTKSAKHEIIPVKPKTKQIKNKVSIK